MSVICKSIFFYIFVVYYVFWLVLFVMFVCRWILFFLNFFIFGVFFCNSNFNVFLWKNLFWSWFDLKIVYKVFLRKEWL